MGANFRKTAERMLEQAAARSVAVTGDTKAREAAAKAMYEGRISEPDQTDGAWADLPEDWQYEWREGSDTAIDAYLAALPAREPVTEDELADAVREGVNRTNTSQGTARHILSQFDVTKKE